jgi:DNA-binding transcriptional MerR regulator
MSEDGTRALRIGEVAALTGTTARTIRYYEEIGLLPATAGREPGSHRLYDEADVERLEEMLRLKDLLGISLDELREPTTAEEALGHIGHQLDLVRRRRAQIAELEEELLTRRRQLRARLREHSIGEPAP